MSRAGPRPSARGTSGTRRVERQPTRRLPCARLFSSRLWWRVAKRARPRPSLCLASQGRVVADRTRRDDPGEHQYNPRVGPSAAHRYATNFRVQIKRPASLGCIVCERTRSRNTRCLRHQAPKSEPAPIKDRTIAARLENSFCRVFCGQVRRRLGSTRGVQSSDAVILFGSFRPLALRAGCASG
jgi:hypothetical protein